MEERKGLRSHRLRSPTENESATGRETEIESVTETGTETERGTMQETGTEDGKEKTTSRRTARTNEVVNFYFPSELSRVILHLTWKWFVFFRKKRWRDGPHGSQCLFWRSKVEESKLFSLTWELKVRIMRDKVKQSISHRKCQSLGRPGKKICTVIPLMQDFT